MHTIVKFKCESLLSQFKSLFPPTNRFNWTDGRINSSNLIELTGQITEKFDEEFRILYAQSLPLNTKERPPSARNSGVYDHLLLKLPSTPPTQAPKAALPEQVCLTSTPSRAQMAMEVTHSTPVRAREKSHRSSHTSNASTLGEDWMERDLLQEEPLCGGPVPVPVPAPLPAPARPLLEAGCSAPADIPTPPASCHISTQTSSQNVDKGVQTDTNARRQSSGTQTLTSTSSMGTDCETTSESSESNSGHPDVKVGLRPAIRRGPAPQNSHLRDSFRKLSKERQGHYASIRTKLDNMVAMLSHRRELVDLTNLALSPALRRRNPNQQSRRAAGVMMETTFMGTWPRSRGLQ